VRLAGEELREHRHVCALVDGPDDAFELLLPLVVGGLDNGDRVFQIVDPALRDSHVARLVARLEASGIDASAAMASRQLEIRTWTESYLKGGRFDRLAQIAYVRQVLREGRDLGFPLTRLIATMSWVPEDPAVMSEMVTYEARLDEVLKRLPDVVVCTYDLNYHSARVIADVLGTHPVALVGGVLRSNPLPPRPSARERLLVAAAAGFHETGIQATGVDSIIEAAGVAKATFYRHFPSKDDLVVAWLLDPRTRWHEGVRSQVEATTTDPNDRILLFFEGTAEWLEAEGYRGCPYLNTGVEITDPAHPARRIVLDYLNEIHEYLHSLLVAARYVDADMLAPQLQALLAGSISLAVARHTAAYALAAREAAERLLAGAERYPAGA
jgi:AcrR family transcriptional regulator